MARRLCVEYPGAVYHLMNRGDRRVHLGIGSTSQGRCAEAPMARRLRRETTMTLRWIANGLNMGTAGSLANLLRDAKAK